MKSTTRTTKNPYKKVFTHEDIPVFEHDTLDYDGDIWIRLRCATAKSKKECECKAERLSVK